MKEFSQFEPDNEFEWEQVLEESDAYAARYFQLLQRFSDLPEADALIKKYLAEEFQSDLQETDFDSEDYRNQWDGALHVDGEGDAPFDIENSLDAMFDEAGEDDGPQPGDALFYEIHPAFQLLQHCALGWCNIYSAVLSPEDRKSGLRTLSYLGRALAYVVSGIGDGLFESPAANAAFSKRALSQLNLALGEMHKLEHDKPQYEKLLTAMREHVLKARSTVFDHLEHCRGRADVEDF
ncbi:MAG: hypothetical protein R6V56_07160 [Lentisphaeria bacterium]